MSVAQLQIMKIFVERKAILKSWMYKLTEFAIEKFPCQNNEKSTV